MKFAQNEGIQRALSGRISVDKLAKPILSDLEIMGEYVRLSYTLFRQEVPFSKHLFIHRAFISCGSDSFRARIGHVSNKSIRQVLRLISNRLWGFIIMMMDDVNYIGLELDDGSDCSHLSHLLLFAKFFWPPPSVAAPSGLPMHRSWMEVRPPFIPPPSNCAQCSQKVKTVHVVCSNGHVTCAECVKKKVYIFKVVLGNRLLCDIYIYSLFFVLQFKLLKHFRYFVLKSRSFVRRTPTLHHARSRQNRYNYAWRTMICGLPCSQWIMRI
jgi:hypothetical protein